MVYLLIIAIGTIAVYIIIDYFLYKISGSQKNKYQLKIIKTMYIAILIIFLFGRGSLYTGFTWNINIFDLFKLAGTNISGLVWISNLLMFIPFNFLFNKVNTKQFVGIIFFIEIMQGLFRVGICDISDLLLYITGYFIGKILHEKLID